MENKEIWKPAKDFEGLYEVSSKGRVRSLERPTIWRCGAYYKEILLPGIVLKPSVTHKGYLSVRLYNNKQKKCRDVTVHRLVMETFVPNPKNFPQINHIDEDKTNNCVDNLEWCTNTYNRNYGSSAIRFCKPVKQIDKNSKEVIAVYESAQHAEKTTGVVASSIRSVCNNKRKTAGGFIWLYS